jgi:hypothetical protein
MAGIVDAKSDEDGIGCRDRGGVWVVTVPSASAAASPATTLSVRVGD